MYDGFVTVTGQRRWYKSLDIAGKLQNAGRQGLIRPLDRARLILQKPDFVRDDDAKDKRGRAFPRGVGLQAAPVLVSTDYPRGALPG